MEGDVASQVIRGKACGAAANVTGEESLRDKSEGDSDSGSIPGESAKRDTAICSLWEHYKNKAHVYANSLTDGEKKRKLQKGYKLLKESQSRQKKATLDFLKTKRHESTIEMSILEEANRKLEEETDRLQEEFYRLESSRKDMMRKVLESQKKMEHMAIELDRVRHQLDMDRHRMELEFNRIAQERLELFEKNEGSEQVFKEDQDPLESMETPMEKLGAPLPGGNFQKDTSGKSDGDIVVRTEDAVSSTGGTLEPQKDVMDEPLVRRMKVKIDEDGTDGCSEEQRSSKKQKRKERLKKKHRKKRTRKVKASPTYMYDAKVDLVTKESCDEQESVKTANIRRSLGKTKEPPILMEMRRWSVE